MGPPAVSHPCNSNCSSQSPAQTIDFEVKDNELWIEGIRLPAAQELEFRYIHRDRLRERGIVPAIARRGTRHGSGLGTYRWVVERTFAWLHGFRRLRIRWERRADIREAFLKLACCLITHRQLSSLH